jgi:excinuclease ABC subunit C
MPENLRDKLTHVSSSPGVYLMKDMKGKVIYVGKARNLKNRLSAYFQKSTQPDKKTNVLISHIETFETVLTATEQEALILESNLIKRYRPKYNVILKDDKRYPVLRMNMSDPYPNLSIVRKIENDNALYFGPFSSASAVHKTIKFINKTFKLRKCRHDTFRQKTRPCLHYQMNQCLAPCCMDVDRNIYQKIVKEVTFILNGRATDLIKNIKADMLTASSHHKFEVAAQLRDKMFALEKIIEKQVAITTDLIDRDIIALGQNDHWSVITLLVVRNGYLLGSRHFEFTETISNIPDSIEDFIKQYYEKSSFIPKEILIPEKIESAILIENWLKATHEKKVRIIVPQRGEKTNLVKMARQNADNRLKEIVAAALSDQALLRRLKHRLKLASFPKRIECVDNSNVFGSHPVAGIVVFENGKPLKSAYRKYSLKKVTGPDDYASMAEVLSRRFGPKTSPTTYPDLLMLDGGKGQLNIALSILKSLRISKEMDILAIAKSKEKNVDVLDKIFLPGRANPIIFRKETDLLLFLQRVRDESHRFAIAFHRKQRQTSATQSILDTIPGVGKKRKQQLLKHFGSIKKIKVATLEEISGLPGFNKNVATAIKEKL